MRLRDTISALLLAAASTGCANGRFEFEYPWMLGLGAVLFVAWFWRHVVRRGPGLAYSRVEVVRTLPMTPRIALRGAPDLLRGLALVALVLACARPQFEDFDQRTVEGIDIFLVLDMSGSMQAVDMSPAEIRQHQVQEREEPPNRFVNAISTLKRFVSHRERDRIGMVVFAREAYMQFPLTLDYSTIQTLLDQLRLNVIDSSSTAIGNALGLGVRGLLDSGAKSRAIILITDGKQQGGNISPRHAAETAQDEGIRIYSILVGREGTAMVPTGRRLADGSSRYRQENYPVDPDLLTDIAELTGGRFYRAAAPDELERDLNEILDELERTQMEDVSSVLEVELFGAFALACVLLLGL